jgi:hypothetical protein
LFIILNLKKQLFFQLPAHDPTTTSLAGKININDL